LTVLFAAFGAFLGMIVLNGLPLLYHPVFPSKRFRRVTTDGFFISLEAADPLFEAAAARKFAESLGAVAVEELKD